MLLKRRAITLLNPTRDNVQTLAAHARRTDPHTSHEAARSFTPDELSRTQQAVYWTLYGLGPSTDEELVDAYLAYARRTGYTRLSHSGVRTRRRELADIGMVVDTGETRATRSGRQAIVWEIKEKP